MYIILKFHFLESNVVLFNYTSIHVDKALVGLWLSVYGVYVKPKTKYRQKNTEPSIIGQFRYIKIQLYGLNVYTMYHNRIKYYDWWKKDKENKTSLTKKNLTTDMTYLRWHGRVSMSCFPKGHLFYYKCLWFILLNVINRDGFHYF